MPPADAAYKTVRISAIKQESSDVKTFVLEQADGRPLPYEAGQFLTFIFQHRTTEVRRSYSLSTSAALQELPAITVKRVENGIYSRYLIDKAKVGDTLQTIGATGLFTLPANIKRYRQAFFLAAGIGITPIFSIIKTLLHSNSDIKVTLIYSNRTTDDTVFYHELQALAAKFPDTFRIEYLYSSAFNLGRARLSKWLLPTLLKEYAQVEKDEMLFYLCGPFSYMRMVSLSLEEQGIAAAHIKRENFNTGPKPLKTPPPPDMAAHMINVQMAGKHYRFESKYPDSILQAAKKQGIPLPYSCETGKCGSCTAKCTSGQVWLSYNEVLTEKDLENGFVLTCTGFPLYGDVTLTL